jgi:methionyl-tRNA formyltransferase
MRCVFFGTPEFAATALEALIASDHEVVGVVCQPDKPAGRGQKLTAPPVKEAALRAGLPHAQPASVRKGDILETLRGWRPDIAVVAAYGRILPPALLTLPPHGCINIHASLLPRYRGAAPIQWAIARGETVTGITIMQMDEGMDTGDILMQRETAITADDTGSSLHDRLARIGAELALEALAAIAAGTATRTPQDHALATHAPMIRKDDGRIDWSRPALETERLVRAFDPWPSTFTFLSGLRLRILRAHVAAGGSGDAPGTVVAAGDSLLVATGAGALALDEVQLEGRKRVGAGVTCGSHLG